LIGAAVMFADGIGSAAGRGNDNARDIVGALSQKTRHQDIIKLIVGRTEAVGGGSDDSRVEPPGGKWANANVESPLPKWRPDQAPCAW
jgi:hypothetical protein